jgi:hypothetical protein
MSVFCWPEPSQPFGLSLQCCNTPPAAWGDGRGSFEYDALTLKRGAPHRSQAQLEAASVDYRELI